MKSILLCAVLSSLMLVGCGGQEDAGTGAPTPAPEEKTEGATASTALPVDMTAFKKDGKLWCPVMDKEVASVEKAVGYQDVDGVRYYFCCGGCPDAFKKEPQKYITMMKTGSAESKL